MSKENFRMMLEALYDGFVVCPNTGLILEVLPGDNKVLCPCGRSNPDLPGEQAERTGCHFVAKLKRATTDQFIAQESKRQGIKLEELTEE